jgi:hypothetical protein
VGAFAAWALGVCGLLGWWAYPALSANPTFGPVASPYAVWGLPTVAAAWGVPAPVTSSGGGDDVCTGGLLLSWHMETTNVLGGSPAGCSVGDTTVAVYAGSPAISSATRSDGTYSARFPSATSLYAFSVATTGDLAKPGAGTLVFDAYFTTLASGGGSVVKWGDSSNSVDFYLLNAGGTVYLNYTGGGTQRSAVIASAFRPQTWQRVIGRWSMTSVGGKYLRLTIDTATGEGSTALTTMSWIPTTFYVGAGGGGGVHVDNLQLYDAWLATNPR